MPAGEVGRTSEATRSPVARSTHAHIFPHAGPWRRAHRVPRGAADPRSARPPPSCGGSPRSRCRPRRSSRSPACLPTTWRHRTTGRRRRHSRRPRTRSRRSACDPPRRRTRRPSPCSPPRRIEVLRVRTQRQPSVRLAAVDLLDDLERREVHDQEPAVVRGSTRRHRPSDRRGCRRTCDGETDERQGLARSGGPTPARGEEAAVVEGARRPGARRPAGEWARRRPEQDRRPPSAATTSGAPPRSSARDVRSPKIGSDVPNPKGVGAVAASSEGEQAPTMARTGTVRRMAPPGTNIPRHGGITPSEAAQAEPPDGPS